MVSIPTLPNVRAVLIQGQDVELLEGALQLFMERHTDESGRCSEFDGIEVVRLRQFIQRVTLL